MASNKDRDITTMQRQTVVAPKLLGGKISPVDPSVDLLCSQYRLPVTILEKER